MGFMIAENVKKKGERMKKKPRQIRRGRSYLVKGADFGEDSKSRCKGKEARTPNEKDWKLRKRAEYEAAVRLWGGKTD